MKAFVFALLAAGALHSYHIRFAAVVGTERFACAAVTVEFLRLYVSRVALEVAFLSFEGSNASCTSGSPQQHDVVSGSVPGFDARVRGSD